MRQRQVGARRGSEAPMPILHFPRRLSSRGKPWEAMMSIIRSRRCRSRVNHSINQAIQPVTRACRAVFRPPRNFPPPVATQQTHSSPPARPAERGPLSCKLTSRATISARKGKMTNPQPASHLSARARDRVFKNNALHRCGHTRSVPLDPHGTKAPQTDRVKDRQGPNGWVGIKRGPGREPRCLLSIYKLEFP